MKITVKALDGGNADFDLPGEITVQELKEKIVEKMGIPLDKQRLIFQGKVLKADKQLKDYGVEGEHVIHLVQNAPPPSLSETATESATQASEPDMPHAHENLLFVSTMPMPAGTGDIETVTQNIVDSIVGSLTAAGHRASVSAHARTVDSSGQTHETVHSATTAPDVTPHVPPPHPSIAQPPTVTPPVPPPTAAQPPQPPSQSEGDRSRLLEEAEQQRRDQEQREQERTRRQLRTIHNHKNTCRRCIQFAKKILDRYDRAEARRAARRRQQAAEAAGSSEEPMEVEKPPEEEMDVTDPTAVPTSEQDDDGEYQPLPAAVYSSLITDIDALQARARPLVDRYLEHIREDKAMEEEPALAASRIAQTVKDFNYYIGHAYVSLSRLHINMGAAPPRVIRLTPPRRTEMRRLMQQIRTLPPRQPQGYIVDITRDAPEGVEGPGHLTHTTSTTITPVSGVGPQGQPGYRLGPITVGATFSMRNRDQGAEGGGAEGGEKKTIDVDVTALPGSQEHMVNIRDHSTGTTETQTLPAQGPSHFAEPKPKAGGEGASAGEEGKEKEEKKDEEEEDDDDDEPVPQVLARLLSELIRGVAGDVGGGGGGEGEEETGGGETGGENRGEQQRDVGGGGGGGGGGGEGGGGGGEGGGGGAGGGGGGGGEGGEVRGEGEQQQTSGGEQEGGEERPLSFAERYAGPEGTTVTIEQQPPVGFPQFPGLPPMRGPSISIRNPGGGQRPEVSVNLPMPPALQLLQNILERRQRERQQQGEGGDQPPPRIPPKPFEDEDGEVESISDAGSIDSIDSNHSEPPELENPMSRIATAAMEELHTGARQSMHATLSELREEYGAPPDEEEDDEDLGMVEQLLQTISRELSVVDVMGVFRGSIEPLQQLQPALINFIREHCLNGAKPTPERKETAVATFLGGCIPAVTSIQDQAPIREGINLAQTLYNSLAQIFREGYDLIISTHTGEMAFAHATHSWGTRSSGRFASVLRHCVVSSEDFDTTVKHLLTAMFPPSTPPMIITMCSSSILNEMRRLRDNVTFTPEELDTSIIWKEGATPQPNPNPARPPPPPASSVLAEGQPLPFVPAASEAIAASSEATATGAEGEEKWPEGMPKEWIPAIKQDHEALTRTRPQQQPYSDAYLSGMPAKRRKLDTSHPETTTAPQLLSRTLQHAITSSGATPTSGASVETIVSDAKDNQELASSLSERMYYNMRERLEKDPDFKPERFPNAQNFYEPRK